MYQILYGSSDKYKLEKFVDIQNPPTLDIYPRLVSFFLDVNTLPDVNGAIPGTTLMFDVIPGSGHYHKVSALLHPDRNPHDHGIQSVLNAAFDLWRPILDNPELKDMTVHDHDDDSSEKFCRRGEAYRQLSQMYFCYMLAVNNAMEMLSPKSLSLWALEKTLLGAEEEEKLLRGGDEDDGKDDLEGLIEMALEAPMIPQTSKKEGKRVRHNGADTRAAITNAYKRMRSDKDEDSITLASRNDLETDPENESNFDPADHPTIDPTLFRQLCPRKGNKRR